MILTAIDLFLYVLDTISAIPGWILLQIRIIFYKLYMANTVFIMEISKSNSILFTFLEEIKEDNHLRDTLMEVLRQFYEVDQYRMLYYCIDSGRIDHYALLVDKIGYSKDPVLLAYIRALNLYPQRAFDGNLDFEGNPSFKLLQYMTDNFMIDDILLYLVETARATKYGKEAFEMIHDHYLERVNKRKVVCEQSNISYKENFSWYTVCYEVTESIAIKNYLLSNEKITSTVPDYIRV